MNYGDKNIRYATVHLDERTPHMHLGIVPFTKDYKLSAKVVFDRKSLSYIQENLPLFLQEQGFNIFRGKENSEAKHLGTVEYKEKIRQLEELDLSIQKKRDDLLNQIELETEAYRICFDKISEVPDVPYRKMLFNNVLLSEEDFDELVNVAKRLCERCQCRDMDYLLKVEEVLELNQKLKDLEEYYRSKDRQQEKEYQEKYASMEKEFREKYEVLENERNNFFELKREQDYDIFVAIERSEYIREMMENPKYEDKLAFNELERELKNERINNKQLSFKLNNLLEEKRALEFENSILSEKNKWLENMYDESKKALVKVAKAINFFVIGHLEWRSNLRFEQQSVLEGIRGFVLSWFKDVGIDLNKYSEVEQGITIDSDIKVRKKEQNKFVKRVVDYDRGR